MIKYSAIVPFHSNINLLTMCVKALHSTLDLSESEIIIVDNNADGSQIDPSWELVKSCKLIRRTENLMYPAAINLGAEMAKGEYLLFCDADTCATPHFHYRLTEALHTGENGYACAKLLNMNSNHILEFGITSSFYNFPHPFAGRSQNFGLVQENHHPLAACAACSAISRDLFLRIGGFDPQLVHSYSDIDLCLRLMNKGYRTICVSDALAYHCGASTSGSGMGPSLKEDTKGIFMAKHPNIPVQVDQYLLKSCEYFLQQNILSAKDYFVLNCSTIINSKCYLDLVTERLGLKIIDDYEHPYPQRDKVNIDFLNFIPHQIRNYRVPLLYFVDTFLSFCGNSLWKSCRSDFSDIVVDRHANVEFLRNI